MTGIRLHYQYGSIPKEDIPMFQDAQGYPYIQDADSFLYYHNAQIGKLDNGLSWFAYYWHRFLSFVYPDITLMGSMGTIAVLFFGLTLLNLFFITYQVTGKYEAGFFAGLLMAINPVMFRASMNADTNTMIWFFTTAIVLFFILLIKDGLRRKDLWNTKFIISKSIYLLAIIGLFKAFSFTWEGWYFIIIIVVFTFIIYLINLAVSEFKTSPILFPSLAIIPLISLIIIIFIKWPFKGYISTGLKEAAGMATIDELKELGIWVIFKMDLVVLVIAVLCFSLWLVYKKKDYMSCFLCTWLLLLLYASSKSFRFLPLAILVYAILGGWLIYELFNMFHTYKNIHATSFVCLFFALVVFCFNDYTSDREFLVDDSIYSLNDVYIPDDTIIVNHWDNGYIIQAFTDIDIRFKGTPSVNDKIKLILADTNESYSDSMLGNKEDKNNYIILTRHDYNVITFQYPITYYSTLSRLIRDESEFYELYYNAETPYNWIKIWRHR